MKLVLVMNSSSWSLSLDFLFVQELFIGGACKNSAQASLCR